MGPSFPWQQSVDPWYWERYTIGPSREELGVEYALARPDTNPSYANLPERDYSVVAWGLASMNTRVRARTYEEAERLAVEGWLDGDLTFDEPEFGFLDADAELWAG